MNTLYTPAFLEQEQEQSLKAHTKTHKHPPKCNYQYGRKIGVFFSVVTTNAEEKVTELLSLLTS